MSAAKDLTLRLLSKLRKTCVPTETWGLVESSGAHKAVRGAPARVVSLQCPDIDPSRRTGRWGEEG